MERKDNQNIQNTSPRPENLSGGVSYAEIVREKERNKKPGRLLDPLYAKVKTDYAHLIIAGILLVVAVIFLLLSWRYNTVKERVFTPGSLSFITSCICFAASLALGLWGLIGLIIHKGRIKEIKEKRE